MVSRPIASDDDNLTSEQQNQLANIDQTLQQISDMLENDTPRASNLIEKIIEDTRHSTLDAFRLRNAHALRLLSRLNYRHMKFADAVANAMESAAIYDLLSHKWGLCRIHWLLGIYHNRFGDTIQALDHLIRALGYAEEIEDYQGIGSVSMMLAVLHQNTDQYERALDQLTYALNALDKVNDLYGKAVAYSNFARTYASMKDFDKAIEYAQQAITLSHQIESEHLQVNSEIVLGDVFVKAEQYERALVQFEVCLAICRQREWFELEVATASKVGAAYIGIGEIEKAVEVLETSLAISRENLSSYVSTDILKVLIQAYEVQENYELAFQSFKTLHELQDAQLEAERSARLYALEQSYQMKVARDEAASQRRRAEEIEVRSQQDREYFQQLNQLRDEFLSAATHDLKNPLASIRTSTYLLRRKLPDNSDFVRHIDMIDNQVARMGILIADMLELAKLETGRALQLKSASVAQLIKETVLEFQHLAEEKSITIINGCSDTPEPIMYLMDLRLMKRALGNLISNAIKYSDEGKQVKIRVEQAADVIHILISDQGMGIAENDLVHIFDRFYRASVVEAAAVEGTGLGLSIVKSIIEQHHGSITVESTLSVGTTFHIHLKIFDSS